jgi:hypothetical protein
MYRLQQGHVYQVQSHQKGSFWLSKKEFKVYSSVHCHVVFCIRIIPVSIHNSDRSIN